MYLKCKSICREWANHKKIKKNAQENPDLQRHDTGLIIGPTAHSGYYRNAAISQQAAATTEQDDFA